jgi:hypothetical protein
VKFELSRLRRGELIVGASAVVLLASMLVLDWFGLSKPLSPTAAVLGVPTSITGWDALTGLRWLIVVTVLCSLLLVFFQATRRAPAIPVSLSVIVTVLAIITTLALIYRVLIDMPSTYGFDEQRAGAFIGLASSIALAYGGYVSMRREGVAPRDAPALADIEVVRLPSHGSSEQPEAPRPVGS